MMELTTSPKPARRWKLAETGMALSVALTAVYAVVICDMAWIMVRNDAGQGAYAVLGLFAAPMLMSWVAIAIWLAPRPLWLRLSMAALLLLAPPLILFGVLNA